MADRTKQEMQFDFLAWCEKERADAAEHLERFESGMLTIGTEGPSGYVDGSPMMMDHLRRIISNMDDLISKVRADLRFIDQ